MDLSQIYADIDSLPVKVDEVVELMRTNIESKFKIHYDNQSERVIALDFKIEQKLRANVQDTSEINHLITNVNNLRKDLEFKTLDFHRYA